MKIYVNQNTRLNDILSKTKPEFKNTKKDGKHILTLSGAVGSGNEEHSFSSSDVREALEGVKEDIIIKINSVGGSVFEGIEIYNYINSLSNHVTVEVTSLAASAASIIAMGSNEVIMNIGSQMMIHRASGMCIGNEGAMISFADTLRSIDNSLISIYVNRTNNSAGRVRKWLNAETWFTAEEAVKYNFADSIGSIAIDNRFINPKLNKKANQQSGKSNLQKLFNGK